MKKARKPGHPATPAIHSTARPVLRVLGTEITQLEQIRRRAEQDLGIDVVFETLDFQSAQRQMGVQKSGSAREPHAQGRFDGGAGRWNKD